jgi:hypothetical protein
MSPNEGTNMKKVSLRMYLVMSDDDCSLKRIPLDHMNRNFMQLAGTRQRVIQVLHVQGKFMPVSFGFGAVSNIQGQYWQFNNAGQYDTSIRDTDAQWPVSDEIVTMIKNDLKGIKRPKGSKAIPILKGTRADMAKLAAGGQ